jgi:predicted ribosome quality control (RQC) complex YloA/Tae2 family protein
MKNLKELSSMDLFFLTKEFQKEIDSRVENFYLEKDSKTFYIKFYNRDGIKKSRFFTISLPNYILIEDEKMPTDEPTGFIFQLRKKLKNSIIRGIEQIPNERILKFIFSKKEDENIEEYFLYVELFSKGNVILTNSQNVILNSIIVKSFRDRKVRVRQVYELPPKPEIDYSLDLSLIKFLSSNLCLGGKFALEVLFRLNFSKDKKICELSKEEIVKLDGEIKNMKNEKINPKIIDGNFYPI